MAYKKLLVFTDLDGSLLDHHTYSHAPAQAMLDKLKEMKVPVIPNTSKTRHELLVLRDHIGLPGPFISENGAAAYVPDGFFAAAPDDTTPIEHLWVHKFTKDREHWLKILWNVESRFEGLFENFSDMGTARISEVTGLSLEEAQRAATRHYSEPVRWLGTAEQRTDFMRVLTEAGACPLRGGRFISVSGECDKGQAMKWMTKQFQKFHPDAEFITVALGDSENDIAMLEAADIAVRIKSPNHELPNVQHPNLMTSTLNGPEGWAECLATILKEQEIR